MDILIDGTLRAFVCIVVAVVLVASGSKLRALYREWRRRNGNDDDFPPGGCFA